MFVETLVTEAPVEALDECVLVRFARLDEVQFDVALVRPDVHRLAGEFRSVVDDNCRRVAALQRHHVSRSCDAVTGDRDADFDRGVTRA